MIGKKDIWDSDKLREILEVEFMVEIDHWRKSDVDKARLALEGFDDVEDFLNKSGWGRDNPELQFEQYLTRNRICRWVDGRFLYFSRILWDSGER